MHETLALLTAHRAINRMRESRPETAAECIASINRSMNWQQMVAMFHRVYLMPVAVNRPKVGCLHMSDERIKLRLDLILEEVQELVQATGASIDNEVLDSDDELRSTLPRLTQSVDGIEVADALGDIIYVVCGFAVELGIDLDLVLQEIQASNLTKLDDEGNPIFRDDGKVLKGPSYVKPDLLAAGIFSHEG